MSGKPEDAARNPPSRPAPWIGEFSVDDGLPTYLVFVEHSVYCSVKSFQKALFAWFALFYALI